VERVRWLATLATLAGVIAVVCGALDKIGLAVGFGAYGIILAVLSLRGE
jgi:hypothetical protein